MARRKRSVDEMALANKSDSDDGDYSDHPVRSSRASASRSKKKPKPTKKKQRRDSDDDIESDEEILSDADELSFQDSEIEDDTTNAQRNARGLVARRAATKRPVYREGASSSDDEEQENGVDEEEEPAEPSPPAKKQKSTVVTLKVGDALKRQYLIQQQQMANRRTTRRTRGASEDIFALTNSGRNMETIQRATRSPEAEAVQPTRRGSRETRDSKNFIVEEEENEKPTEEEIDETTTDIKGSQVEIQESAHGSFEEPAPAAEIPSKENGNTEEDEGFVPESENGDTKNDQEDEDEDDEGPTTRRRTKSTRNSAREELPPEDDGSGPRRSSRKRPPRSSQRKNAEDESDFEPDESHDDEDELSQSEGKSQASPRKGNQVEEDDDYTTSRRPGLRKRTSRSRGQSESRAEIADELAEELQDLRGGRSRRRLQPEIVYEKPRRNRKDVDYRIIRPDIFLPIEEAENEVNESPSRRGRGGGGGGGTWQRTLFPTYGPFGGGGPSAILAGPDAPAATGGVDSDSSDDEGIQPVKGPGSAAAPAPGVGLVTSAQTHGADPVQGSSGTPGNLGKIKDKQSLADADPLGVDLKVNFESVGGLQGHIDQLKEMVSLPLLYPEIFQRFHITPPRGVLFHGPPGTGKTLLARALANSVSSEGRKVTFYMRKGADALSKWVGEAERQLRLLFDEARKTQPSIIFFDEIDGLAPVRSSKQEQIHASIVSTLLALMDGMDGRGQVIVIGATNRPDSVDPALRRPGRFDREFYFPLPNKEGRRSILDIHTMGWDPPLPNDIKDELAELSKGYGGADLRALCTEAALNAVQRRYPQIYKSDQKLVIDPKSISVSPKDFMLAIKKMVPSSERSTSSGASPLPKTVEPLLRRPLAEVEKQLSEILPQQKRLTALEEAQFEEPEASGSFRREHMQQEFDRSRVFRPRLLLRGYQGMGQQYLASAILHHFEGLHVQPFDLPTLLSDSTRSVESAVIQLFAEVKRHKPSVIYIPSISSWHDETVGRAVISTFLGLLRSIPPSDPILVLGVLESSGERDDEKDSPVVKNLFGFSKKNFYELQAPDHNARHDFFAQLVDYIKVSPAEFPDPENRKKRELEHLEVAPPPPPKPATPLTKEQQKAQKKKDYQTLNLLKIRIQPIMDQIKKYKRFRGGVIDESQIRYLWEEDNPNIVTSDLPIEQRTTFRPFEKAQDKHGALGLREAVSGKFFYNMEIVTIEKRLSNGYYKRPKDFLADIKRLAKDAKQVGEQERILRANELLSNVEVDVATIEQAEPALVAECEQVYLRELEREKAALERARRAEEEDEDFVARPPTGNRVPHGNTDSTLTSGPVGLGESFGESGGAKLPPEQPVTPSRRSQVSFLTNGYHHHQGGGSDLNDLSTQAVMSNSSHGDGDGDVYMTNSEDNSASKETQNSSFGPSAQPRPPHSHTAPSQQVRRESGLSSLSQKGPMTPMAPGSQPHDYVNEASTTETTSKKSSEQLSYQQQQQQQQQRQHSFHSSAGQGGRHDYPDLTQYPDRASLEEHLPDTQQEGSSQPSPRPAEFTNAENNVPNGSQQSKHQPPVPLFDAPAKQAHHCPADLQSLLNNEDQPPKMLLDHGYLKQLHDELTQRTSGCSVEQLEQINTNLMDYVWRMRGEWNRTHVAAGIAQTFNAVLEDMQEMQEIGPISQRTKEQLEAASSFRM